MQGKARLVISGIIAVETERHPLTFPSGKEIENLPLQTRRHIIKAEHLGVDLQHHFAGNLRIDRYIESMVVLGDCLKILGNKPAYAVHVCFGCVRHRQLADHPDQVVSFS